MSMSTPSKKAPFRPASSFPTDRSAASSPLASPGAAAPLPPSMITPPKTRIPMRSPTGSGASTPTQSQPHSQSLSSLTQSPSPFTQSSSAMILRNSPQALNKLNKDKRLSGEINAARSYLTEQSNLTQASQLVSSADRRNKLKKRLLIQQTEKIKEMLWEKASLIQKKQLIDDETKEFLALKKRVEDEREERQKKWVMEEAIRREEEEEEIRYAFIRGRKFQQRYDFELAKREKMLKNKAEKDLKKANFAEQNQAELRRVNEERKRISAGIVNELDSTLGLDEDLSMIQPVNNANANGRRPSVGDQSTTSTLSDGDVARQLTENGFKDSTASASTPHQSVRSRSPSMSPSPPVMKSMDDDLESNTDDAFNVNGVVDDDVEFDSSDDDEDEASESRRGSQSQSKLPSSSNPAEMGAPSPAAAAAAVALMESIADREAREAREAAERAQKEKEWQELKARLLSEARELQEKERQRVAEQRELETKRAAEAIAAKEAEMNELIAKLKEVEVKTQLAAAEAAAASALPAPAATETSVSSTAAATPATSAQPETFVSEQPRAVMTPVKTNSDIVAVALPALSSITLRSASSGTPRTSKLFDAPSAIAAAIATTAIASAGGDEEIDEPKQAPGALVALPSLSATPQRRLNSSTTVPTPTMPKKPKSEVSESMAISSMLHELESLEEEEEMMLKLGMDVTKLPRTGKPKVCKLYVDKNSSDDWIVRWDTKKKNKDEAMIVLNECKVSVGIGAGLFLKPENEKRFSDKRNRCFSLISADRTLDVCCLSFNDQELWTRTLARLARQRKKPTQSHSDVHSGAATPGAQSQPQSAAITPAGSRRGSNILPKSANNGNAASTGADSPPHKEIENYLSKHLKNF